MSVPAQTVGAARPKILLITYEFPPAGGVAVQRMLNMAKYLPQQGYEVHVLTAPNAASAVRDPSLRQQVPPEVRVHHAYTPELPYGLRRALWSLLARKKAAAPAATPAAGPAPASQGRGLKDLIRRVLSPDPEVVWKPSAVWMASRLIRRHQIDVVLVTAPPFSIFLTGIALKKRFPHLTLVADYRDDWFGFYMTHFEFQKGEAIRQRAEAIERELVASADLVTAASPVTLAGIRQRHAGVPAQRFACIHNGFDPAAFTGFQARPHEGDRIVLTHVGTTYHASSPRHLIAALDSLPEAMRNRFELRFAGRVTDDEKPFLDAARTRVVTLGFLPHGEAIRQMEEADYLLLIMADPATQPGKLFEYLATGKPIVALAPTTGAVPLVLQETGAGRCVDAADVPAIAALLRDLAAEVDARRPHTPDWEAIRRYERPRLAAEFARLLRLHLDHA